MNNPLSNLIIFDESQLKNASKDQLISLFNQIDATKKNVDQQLMNNKVQLNTCQNEYDKLMNEIQTQFGTTSIEGLETLKQTKIEELAKLGQELKTVAEGANLTNG